MKGGHTPGPWMAASHPSSKVGLPVVSQPSGRSIASVTFFHLGDAFANHDRESQANARLIAAAPELLDALEEALGLRLVGTNNPNIGDDQILPVDVTMGELRRARAAIAKARGDT